MAASGKQYVIELDGTLYKCSGDRLEQIEDLRDVTGICWFVSDFQGAISRTMTLEAPMRYTEAMVRKKLQEAGEFDEPVSIVTHWKRQKISNVTDIFFTALPTRLYLQYLEQTKSYEDSLLLFPLYSLLCCLLRHMRQKGPVAVVFQHNRFADLIIGTRKKVFFANRSVAFDKSDEQISALWDMIMSDIRNTEAENRINVGNVLTLTWLNSVRGPDWPDDMENRLFSMEEQLVYLDEEHYSVSFLKAMEMMSGLESISGHMEKVSYYAQRVIPYLNSIVLLVTLLFFLGYFWYARKSELVETELKGTLSQIPGLRQEAAVSEIPYKETFGFVRELGHYQKMPSFKELLGDISGALPEGVIVDSLKADFDDDEVKIEASARVRESFDMAYRGYQNFLYAMRQKGYVVSGSDFNTIFGASLSS